MRRPAHTLATTSPAWPLRLALLAAVLSAAASPAHASDDARANTLSGPTMGTAYHIALGSEQQPAGLALLKQRVDDRLAEINRRMSTYDPESELSRFNASRSDEWFAVSSETATVVAAALDIAQRSDGTFDPTVGPLVNLWGFGPANRKGALPTDEQLAKARARVGYSKVEVRRDPPALRKTNPRIYLDLSAIAKGYAADAIAEMLTGHSNEETGVEEPGVERVPSVDSVMVEIGGEIRTIGTKASGDPWRLGIERPDDTSRIVSHVLEVRGSEAIATSGDYRNFYERDGQRFSHTIDPATGRPVTHQLATVTIRTPTCMEADALATALSVMGPKKGLAWAEQQGIAALLVDRTDGGFREQTTSHWDQQDTRPTAAGSSTSEGNMLTYVIISIVVFAIALAGMAVGVIVSNRRISGTCGGLAGMQDGSGKTACELCTNPSPTCTGDPQEAESAAGR